MVAMGKEMAKLERPHRYEVRLSDDEMDWLLETARNEGVSAADVIRGLLRDFHRKLKNR